MAVTATSTDLWNNLFFLYLAIALVVGGLVVGWLVTSLVKYRWRPGTALPKDAPIPGVEPAERGHVLWVYIMTGAIAAIMFGLAFSTISAVEEVDHPPAGVPSIYVNVTGYQFGWIFDYHGEGGVPIRQTTPSDTQGLYVPVGVPVVMNVTSRDVWHNFAIPNFRIRVDAIPGEINHLWFNATTIGDDHTVCVMLCGSNHAVMRANMFVRSHSEFDAWLHGESTKAYDKLATAGKIANATIKDNSLEIGGLVGIANDCATRNVGSDTHNATEPSSVLSPSFPAAPPNATETPPIMPVPIDGDVALHIANCDQVGHRVISPFGIVDVPASSDRWLFTGPLSQNFRPFIKVS